MCAHQYSVCIVRCIFCEFCFHLWTYSYIALQDGVQFKNEKKLMRKAKVRSMAKLKDFFKHAFIFAIYSRDIRLFSKGAAALQIQLHLNKLANAK